MNLVEILDTHRHDILRPWAESVRREAPETRGLSDGDLISNYPLLFDRLVRGLGGGSLPPAVPESREHAATRKRQGIGLPTLLREYTLLQQAIKEFAHERLGSRPADAESRRLDAILFLAVEEAVLAYTATVETESLEARGRVDSMLVALAHDIRTPLNAMTLTLTVMEMKLGDRLDEEDRSDLSSLRAGISTVLDMHRAILDHRRLAAGRIDLKETEFPLDGVLATTVQVVRSLATFKGIAVVLDLATGATVRTDKAMLQQVVGNLLSNAIRYTVEGTITVRSRLDAGGVTVEVEDTGIGMTREVRDRVFDEFFQADTIHRNSGEGYGLGMTVARRMARLMGGELTVESASGTGSRFTLTLPPSVTGGRGEERR